MKPKRYVPPKPMEFELRVGQLIITAFQPQHMALVGRLSMRYGIGFVEEQDGNEAPVLKIAVPLAQIVTDASWVGKGERL